LFLFNHLKNNNMKTSILISILFFTFSVCFGQDILTEEIPSPDIKFEQTTIDLGTISDDSNPVIIYRFTNTGSSPLLLKKVKPSCGCTIPKWPQQPIAAGESGEIKATFSTRGSAGKFVRKSIVVTTNIKENGTDKVFNLVFKGHVETAK